MSSNLNAAPSKKAEDDGPAEAAEFEKILYHITHDVRAALRAIQTLPDWIKEDLEKVGTAVSPTVFEDLELLKTQTARADQILIDLRTYSRIGRKSDTPSIVDLSEALDEACRQIELAPSFQIESALEAPLVFAPRNDVVTFLHSLISNSAKHHTGPDGQIYVRSHDDPRGIMLAVEDDGPGIETEFRERVFDLMTTLRPRDECEGSGVGLALVRKIMESLGGQVTISSPTRLSGTCVTAIFPRKNAPVRAI